MLSHVANGVGEVHGDVDSEQVDRDPLIALGKVIMKRRLAMHLSQAQLAQMTGVHRTYLSDIERGQRNITFLTLAKLAACLKMSAGKLIRMSEKLIAQTAEQNSSSASTSSNELNVDRSSDLSDSED